jgi:hypothetical protein
MTTAEIKAWNRSERVIYLENTGWIFASRGNEGVISDVVAGSILQNAGESGGFVKVVLPDGRTGYLPSGCVKDFTGWKYAQSVNTDDICIRAASMLGIPYLWGGTSTKGADCSGYVQTVYFLNGYILQRDASLQALHGESIDLSDNFKNLLPGDLLFFGPMRNGKPRVTHVGIYKGSMEYIHSSGMVNINSLDSSKANFSGPRLKLLLMAKRIVGASTGEGIVAVKDHPLY